MTPAPKFKRVASGLYDTPDGIFTLFQVPGVYPPGWNVEWTTEFTYEHAFTGDPVDVECDLQSQIVDGAATKRDALGLFADWWNETGSKLPLPAAHARSGR